jgi:hypothetical protein
MANGTIAFDTLTTSDQANTGTEKSIDTSYIFNGVAKHWILFNGTGTVAVNDSFNNSGLLDNGTGEYKISFTNIMANNTFSVTTGGAWDETGAANGANARQGPASCEKTTESFELHCASNTTTANDWESPTAQTLGDLA